MASSLDRRRHRSVNRAGDARWARSGDGRAEGPGRGRRRAERVVGDLLRRGLEDRGRPGGFTGDPDVFDTWATSSLTPQIAGGWIEDPDRFATVMILSMSR